MRLLPLFPPAFQRSPYLSALFLVALALLLSSCARPQYPSGEWVSSMKVADAFEDAWVFQDHTYYYVGSIAKPDGVIAIDNRYRLRDNNVWAKVDVDASTLREWQHWWRADTFHHCRYLGGVIRTPDGRQAGYWYSPFRNNIVQMPEEGVLLIYRPRSVSGATDCEGGDRDGMNFFWLN